VIAAISGAPLIVAVFMLAQSRPFQESSTNKLDVAVVVTVSPAIATMHLVGAPHQTALSSVEVPLGGTTVMVGSTSPEVVVDTAELDSPGVEHPAVAKAMSTDATSGPTMPAARDASGRALRTDGAGETRLRGNCTGSEGSQ
jgi:hypothetical protein